MQIIADLHTHTLSATHAFNTLDEMAAKAAALGYAALAITDHGPAMPDAPHMWHFANQTALPLVLHGVAMTQLQGSMPPLLAMLEEMQFPQELVVNATRQNLVNELKLHGRICAEYIEGEIL